MPLANRSVRVMASRYRQLGSRLQRHVMWLGFLAWSTCAVQAAEQNTTTSVNPMQDTPPVVMVSLDGFRHDYAGLYSTPNLDRLAAQGLAAEGLIPVFPSKTFPNHYSIVTGLYPGNHGIIGNSFYDRDRKASYSIGNRDSVENGSWYGGTPLWVAVEQAGGIAASFFWVGSEADVQGVRPTHYRLYNGRVPNAKRVDQALTWLQSPPEERPNFITLYFSSVDSIGHGYGPQSPEVATAVTDIDKQIGRLMAGLSDLPFATHLVIVSDHGMQQMDKSKEIYLNDFMSLDGLLVKEGGPVTFFYERDLDARKQLAKELRAIDNITVHEAATWPKEFRLAPGPRTPDIIVTVDAPYTFLLRPPSQRYPSPAGNHGFIPSETPSMRGILYAMGPQITAGSVAPPLENIHIYPLVMRLLNLPIREPIDGRLDVLEPYLKSQLISSSTTK